MQTLKLIERPTIFQTGSCAQLAFPDVSAVPSARSPHPFGAYASPSSAFQNIVYVSALLLRLPKHRGTTCLVTCLPHYHTACAFVVPCFSARSVGWKRFAENTAGASHEQQCQATQDRGGETRRSVNLLQEARTVVRFSVASSSAMGAQLSETPPYAQQETRGPIALCCLILPQSLRLRYLLHAP